MGHCYKEKMESLCDIFGRTDIVVEEHFVLIGCEKFPILEGVIVLLHPSQYTEKVRKLLEKIPCELGSDSEEDNEIEYSKEIQNSFSLEWVQFDDILDEHFMEFKQYFDIVDIDKLGDARVCDLGCGMGRWSYFLRKKCQELVLVDFSDAIFIARRNFSDVDNALFFMGDIRNLPFRSGFCDFLFSLGVLHHLPTNALSEVRNLAQFSPDILVYLYYALDNRPVHFRVLFFLVDVARKILSSMPIEPLKVLAVWAITLGVYFPLIGIGHFFKKFGFERYIPLFEFYSGKGIRRVRQDVYDRFCTRIEQRFSRSEILELQDSFGKVEISEGLPYWHFRCIR